MAQRGIITNPDRKRQLNDFSQMNIGINGTITPTDLDGFIEYENKAYLFYEIKYGNATMSRGQEIALKRMAYDLSFRKDVMVMVLEHNVHDPKETVPIHECVVRQMLTTMNITDFNEKSHKLEWEVFPDNEYKAGYLQSMFVRHVNLGRYRTLLLNRNKK
jgi:hypothetical protein